MNIKVIRISKKGVAIDGHLYIDGMKICDTAENAEYCLNPGTYPVVRHKCKQKARFIPVILQKDEGLEMKDEGNSLNSQLSTLNCKCSRCEKLDFVTNNSSMPCFCPQITMGNGVYSRKDGSILVGTRIVRGCLKLTKEPFENICERLRKLNGRGTEITLTIVDETPKPTPLTPYVMGTRILHQMHTRKLVCE